MVTVTTGSYERAHFKKPRGFGRWAFYMGSEEGPLQFYNGSYADAKKQAVQYAKEHGYYRVIVGS